nr:hypothetical protein [Tanacetum cinerariifolium]
SVGLVALAGCLPLAAADSLGAATTVVVGVGPTLSLGDIGLLDFVKSADPFKVKAKEITLVEGEKRKVGFSAGPPPMKRARAGGVGILEPNPTTTGKSPIVIQKLIAQSGQPNICSGFAAHHAKEFVSFFVTLTPEHECQDESDSTQGGNVWIRRASEHYFILSSSPYLLDKDLNTSSKVGSPNLHVHIGVENMAAAPINGTEAPSIPKNDTGAASLPGNGTGTSSLPRYEAGTSSLLTNETGASSSAPIDGSLIDDFFESQTIDSAIAQDINYEHEIITREKFKHKFVKSSEVVHQRDAKIVSLKAKVKKAKSEAGEVIKLRRQVSLKAVAVAKSEEIVGLTAQNTELLGNVSGLESEGLEAVIEHGKASRSLAKVAAYDPRVGAGCVTAVNELEDDSFLLLEQLEALKDYPLRLLISSLTLELADLAVPFQDTSLVVANYQISSVAIFDDAVPSSKPHDDLFNTTVLAKPVVP